MQDETRKDQNPSSNTSHRQEQLLLGASRPPFCFDHRISSPQAQTINMDFAFCPRVLAPAGRPYHGWIGLNFFGVVSPHETYQSPRHTTVALFLRSPRGCCCDLLLFSALASGLLNYTIRAHEILDWYAKLSRRDVTIFSLLR